MNETLGRNIVSFRKKINMTQTQLAERMCVTYQTISNWERGVSFPDVEAIGRLCEIFSVSLDELFGLKAHSTQSRIIAQRKRTPVVSYYQEKTKSAKLLTVLTIILLVSFVAVKFSANALGLGVFGAILYLISAPIFLLSVLGTIIFLFVAKDYARNKIFLVLYLACLIAFIILTIVGIKSYVQAIYEYVDGVKNSISLKDILSANRSGNAVMIIANICYYASSVLIYFVFKDKSADEINSKFIFLYFVCIIADLFFSLVIKLSVDSFFILSLVLLVYIKKDKTTEIPYYTDSDVIRQMENEKISKAKFARELMPASSSGIPDKNRQIDEIEYVYQKASIKIRLSDIFSGGVLTGILVAIISIIVIFSLSTGLLSVASIIILMGVLPLIFYLLCFICKVGGKSKIIDICFLGLIIVSVVVQNFIFMENLTLLYFDVAYVIMAVVLQLICLGYFVLFYKRNDYCTFKSRIILLVVNFVITSVFVVIATLNADIKLGMLFFIMVLNLITALIASLTGVNKFE